MSSAMILSPARIDIDVLGQVTVGDLLVGLGTLALAGFTLSLAVFTSRLASQTYELDRRNAARERQRRERQVRGITRLVDGELNIVVRSIQHALRTGQWWFFLTTPRGAWDRDGALIAETVAQGEALDIITAFSKLDGWQSIVAVVHESTDEDSISVDSSKRETLADLLGAIEQARRHLDSLAYPDTSDLEPDPDLEPPPRPPAARWWSTSRSR